MKIFRDDFSLLRRSNMKREKSSLNIFMLLLCNREKSFLNIFMLMLRNREKSPLNIFIHEDIQG
jgi:hypothetical protein